MVYLTINKTVTCNHDLWNVTRKRNPSINFLYSCSIPVESLKNFIAPPLRMMGFRQRSRGGEQVGGGGGSQDFFFKEADEIWTLDKYVAGQDG